MIVDGTDREQRQVLPTETPAAEKWRRSVSELGPNLRRLRTRRGLSLDALARASGVSRSMLGHIELADCVPSVGVLLKVLRALDVPFSAVIGDPPRTPPTVIRATKAKGFASQGQAAVSRALFPSDAHYSVEFYEVRLAPASVERADAHPPGTRENLVVASGELGLVISGTRYDLSTGDAVLFESDVPHEYRNERAQVLHMYLVVTYSGERRRSTSQATPVRTST